MGAFHGYEISSTFRPAIKFHVHVGGAFMTPFVKVARNPASSMHVRWKLLQQPAEFFSQCFGGRLPTLWEKAICIEKAVQAITMVNGYENDLYRVTINYFPPFAHLAIRRRDGQPCKDWQHFQQIKNEIIGSENEAMELFPAESRLVDSENEYHLWVHTDPHFRFPVGFGERFVLPVLAERALASGGEAQRSQVCA